MLKQTYLAAGATVALAVFGQASAQALEAPAQYGSSCTFCHSNGAAGAPLTGDAEAWAPRLEKGMDVLVKNVRDGIGAMPPTGMCGTCSDDELKALIEFMAADAEGSKE